MPHPIETGARGRGEQRPHQDEVEDQAYRDRGAELLRGDEPRAGQHERRRRGDDRRGRRPGSVREPASGTIARARKPTPRSSPSAVA